MNAGAYGSDWSAIVTRALVATADGAGWLTPAELGLSYRHSSIRHGQVVAAVEYQLEPRDETEIRADVRDLVDRRKATQPTTKRTFGSVFKNPPGELGAGAMLERCGLKGHQIGGALISPKHANFIENAGGATTADCLALMAEARRRAREQFGVELEHEVVLLGEIVGRLHGAGGGRRHGGRRKEPRGHRGTSRTWIASPCARGGSRRTASATGLRRAPRSFPARSLRPLARDRVPDRSRRCSAPGSERVRRACSPSAPSTCEGRPRLSRLRFARRSPRAAARACSRSTSTSRCRRWRRSRPSRAPASTAPFPHTLRVVVVPERGVAIVRQGADSYLVAESGRVMGDRRPPRPARARPDLGEPGRQARRRRDHHGRSANRRRSRRAARRLALPGPRGLGHGDRRRAHAAAPVRASRSASATRSTFRSSSRSRPG